MRSYNLNCIKIIFAHPPPINWWIDNKQRLCIFLKESLSHAADLKKRFFSSFCPELVYDLPFNVGFSYHNNLSNCR